MSETTPDAAASPWINHYDVVLPNATGDAILMLPGESGWQLPYARCEDIWLSSAAQIIPVLRDTLGLDFAFTILRHLRFEVNEAEKWDRCLLVLEPIQPLDLPPLHGQWIDGAALQMLPLAHTDQRAPLLHYLEENAQGPASPLIDLRRAPWARPGWFAAAAAWITAAISELGYTPTAPVEQLRNWSISSLLIAHTTGGRLFFKAAAAFPLFVPEPALTYTLATLFPDHLPTPLKIDHAQRWMLMQDVGTPEWDDEAIDLAPLLRTYGELQRESSHHLDNLKAAGCLDRSLAVLAAQIDPLLTDPLTRQALTPAEYDELCALAPMLKARCATVATSNIPLTLLHGDLHLGNVVEKQGHYIFFDWTDAAISFPFLDLFMLYFDRWQGHNITPWRDAYLEVWREYESPARLLELWELAKPLCALHHAVSYLSIINHLEPLTRGELYHGFPDNLHRLLTAVRVESSAK